MQQTAHDAVEQPAIEPTEDTAETACTGRSRNRAYRSKAQTEREPGCTDPSCRCHCSSPYVTGINAGKSHRW
jgi:hypothetical protein